MSSEPEAVAMSPSDAIRTAAREAVLAAGAVKRCPRDPKILVRTGDETAEHYAYALATTALKKEGAMDWRQEILDAIKGELDAAADGCPGEMRGRRLLRASRPRLR
jgi:hypothetical protein